MGFDWQVENVFNNSSFCICFYRSSAEPKFFDLSTLLSQDLWPLLLHNTQLEIIGIMYHSQLLSTQSHPACQEFPVREFVNFVTALRILMFCKYFNLGISGVSGVSSASSCSSSSYKTCASSFSSASLKKRSYTKQGYQPLRTSSPSPSRSPQSNTGDISSRTPSIKSQGQSKELSVKSTQLPSNTKSNQGQAQEPPVRGKLSLIQEFQREFRNGKSKAVNERKGSAGSGSTRIK